MTTRETKDYVLINESMSGVVGGAANFLYTATQPLRTSSRKQMSILMPGSHVASPAPFGASSSRLYTHVRERVELPTSDKFKQVSPPPGGTFQSDWMTIRAPCLFDDSALPVEENIEMQCCMAEEMSLRQLRRYVGLAFVLWLLSEVQFADESCSSGLANVDL